MLGAIESGIRDTRAIIKNYVPALMFAVFFTLLPDDIAWRALFWIGLAPALLVFYFRRHVKDPEVFTATLTRTAEQRANFLEIFSPQLRRITVLTSLMATGMQGGYYAVTIWLPTYLKTVRVLSVIGTGGYLAVIISGAFTGYLTAAWLSDRIGRRKTFFLFAVCSALSAETYTPVPISDAQMLVLRAIGIFSGAAFVVVIIAISLLPERRGKQLAVYD